MLKCSFQHTADFLWPVDSSSSKDAHILKPKPPSNYHCASKSLEGPIVRHLHSKHRTFRSLSSSWVKRTFCSTFKLTLYAHILKPKPPSNYHCASKSLERPHSPSFAFKTPHVSKPFVIAGEPYILQYF